MLEAKETQYFSNQMEKLATIKNLAVFLFIKKQIFLKFSVSKALNLIHR